MQLLPELGCRCRSARTRCRCAPVDRPGSGDTRSDVAGLARGDGVRRAARRPRHVDPAAARRLGPACSSTSGRSRPARRLDPGPGGRWFGGEVPDLDDAAAPRVASWLRWPNCVRAQSRGVPRPVGRRTRGRLSARWRSPGRWGCELDVRLRGRAVRRGARRGARCAGRRPRGRRGGLRRPRAGRARLDGWAARHPTGGCRSRWRGSGCSTSRCATCAQAWDEVSSRIAVLRDNPACAEEEHDAFGADDDPGLVVAPSVRPDRRRRGALPVARVCGRRSRSCASRVSTATSRPHSRSTAPGFDTYDVHMTDLQTGRFDLADVVGLVACGGFSYGDMLGAGEGWARSVLLQRAAHRGLPRLLPPRRHLRRWASATGARCSRRWPTSSRAPRRGRGSPATGPSSTRRGSPWSRCSSRRRS